MLISFFIGSVILISSVALILFKIWPYLDICIVNCSEMAIGISFLIYNGKKFIPITVSEDMVGHKMGEFAPTRTFFGHTPADKKAKPAEKK